MAPEPFIVNLGALNHSLVRGCPGVPKTCPRVESVLEIRSKDGGDFVIKTITLELNTIQSVSVPLAGGLGLNDAHRAYSIYKDTIYRAPTEGTDKVLGMDLPFVIPLPKDVILSGKNARWNAKTVHNVMVRIGWVNGSKIELFSVSFPLIIKRYDTLPLYRQFNEPITKTVELPDKTILVEYSLPNLSVGPKDELVLYMKILPNQHFLQASAADALKRSLFMKRKPPVYRLKKIQFELREVLVCHEAGLLSKQTKLLSKQQDFDTELSSDGITTQILFDFPSEVKGIILNLAAVATRVPLLNSALNQRGLMEHQLSKKLTGVLGSSKRKSLDLRSNRKSLDLRANRKSLDLRKDTTPELVRSASEEHMLADTSLDLLEIKPMPTAQTFGAANNHRTLTTNTKLFDEVSTGVPLTHMQGFTTNGKLFLIKYELVFRVKVSSTTANLTKLSVKFSQPITVLPYDRIQSVKLLKWIMKEWELAQFINNSTFQTNFNNEKANIINSFTEVAELEESEGDEGEDSDEVNTDELDTTNRFLHEAVFAHPHANNFSNILKSINNYNDGKYYFDYSIGALRNSEFENKRLNKRDFSGEDPHALTIYQSKPSHVYRPQNQMDWKMLGLSERALGRSGKGIVHYID